MNIPKYEYTVISIFFNDDVFALLNLSTLCLNHVLNNKGKQFESLFLILTLFFNFLYKFWYFLAAMSRCALRVMMLQYFFHIVPPFSFFFSLSSFFIDILRTDQNKPKKSNLKQLYLYNSRYQAGLISYRISEN